MVPRPFYFSLIVSFIVTAAAIWLWSATGDMSFRDAEYPMWMAKKQMVAACRDWDVAILGDSRAMADLVPGHLGPSVVNLALGGGTPIEMYYTVQRMMNCPRVPHAIIMSFSAYHFMIHDIYWGRTADFNFLTLDQMEEVRTNTNALHAHPGTYETDFFGNLEGILKNYLYALKFPMHGLTFMAHNFYQGRLRENRIILEQIFESRGYHVFGNANGSKLISDDAGFPAFKEDPLMDYYTDRTLALFKARNIPVYFMATPVSDVSYDRMAPAFIAGFTRYLDAYQTRYDNFHVIGAPVVAISSAYFGDGSHLNERGAVFWTDRVRDSGAMDIIAQTEVKATGPALP
jgi:hypothetical protein